MLRKNISDAENYSFHRIVDFYKKVSEIYGDSFINQILNLHDSYRFKNFFDLNLKVKKEICDSFRIKLRSSNKCSRVENGKIEEIFENYSMIRQKDIDIKFGKKILIKKSKFFIKCDQVSVEDKNIYLVKYESYVKKEKYDLKQNLAFYYRDAFL